MGSLLIGSVDRSHQGNDALQMTTMKDWGASPPYAFVHFTTARGVTSLLNGLEVGKQVDRERRTLLEVLQYGLAHGVGLECEESLRRSTLQQRLTATPGKGTAYRLGAFVHVDAQRLVAVSDQQGHAFVSAQGQRLQDRLSQLQERRFSLDVKRDLHADWTGREAHVVAKAGDQPTIFKQGGETVNGTDRQLALFTDVLTGQGLLCSRDRYENIQDSLSG